MILIRSSFAGEARSSIPISDTIPVIIIDTICVPVPEFKALYTAAQQYQGTAELLKIADAQIVELQIKIDILQKKDKATVEGYDNQLRGLKDEIVEYKIQKKEYERLLKWEKFKRRFWTSVGVAVVGVMGYLYITK